MPSLSSHQSLPSPIPPDSLLSVCVSMAREGGDGGWRRRWIDARIGSGSSGARTGTEGGHRARPPPPSPTTTMSSTAELFHNG
jgi:hypothetical protein